MYQNFSHVGDNVYTHPEGNKRATTYQETVFAGQRYCSGFPAFAVATVHALTAA